MEKYKHLQGVELLNTESKEEYPIHVILVVNEYSKSVERIGEPMAELTWLGWVIMSLGYGVESSMYLMQTSHSEYDILCQLNVLGLEDRPDGDPEVVYEEFQEELQRDSNGWYETGLLWKLDTHPNKTTRK